MEEALRLSHVRQRLRVAQMGVHVHQPDLAAEERCALCPLEDALRPTVVRNRAVEQARAVGSSQVLLDKPQMLARLRRGQHILENRMDERQCAISYAVFCLKKKTLAI